MSNLFLDKPCFLIIFGLLSLIGLTYLTYHLEYYKQQKVHPREMMIWHDPMTIDWDKMTVAEEYL
jgi:hypothetical protein